MRVYQNILACVTKQKNCERLIMSASQRRAVDGSLHILHVAKNSWNILDNVHESQALEYLFKTSKFFDAEMTMLRADNISETIAAFAKNHNIDLVVLGASINAGEHKFFKQLRALLKDTNIEIEILSPE